MDSKLARILLIYCLGGICLYGYHLVVSSKYFIDLLDMATRAGTNREFYVLVVLGLLRFTLLVSGLALIIIATWRLVKKKS